MARKIVRIFFCLISGSLTFLLQGAPIIAQTSLLKNIDVCDGVGGVLVESQIRACTELITSPALKPQGRAVAHNNRGNAYIRRADYDSAIQDFDQSLRINPSYAKALNNRGVAYQKKGEHDRSIKDFDEAIKLDPNYLSTQG
jgi:lipoprotein NlpI